MKTSKLIIIPLIAISFLASCSKGGNPEEPIYHYVTFVTNGGSEIEKVKVEDNQVLKKPTDPTKTGYVFDAWCLDEELTNEYDFTFFVTEDFTLYAKWIKEEESKQYNVTYKNVIASEHPDDPTSYTSEDEIILSTPIRTDWTFKGWYTDENFESKRIYFIPKDSVGDLTLYAKMVYKTTTLEDCTWDEIKMISENGGARATFGKIDGTQTKRVQLTHQDKNNNGVIDEDEAYQTVRIIGYNQDIDASGKTIGITFEFADLISDAEGYSLATQWNDVKPNEASTATYNYLDSSVRRTLTGEYQKKAHILWAQWRAKKWSNEEGGLYTNKSVLDMLPEELKTVLNAPEKKTWIKENNEWIQKPIINSENKYDKLFILTPEEMGSDFYRKGAYTYYQEFDDAKLNILRIKKQIKGAEIYTDIPKINSHDQYYSGDRIPNLAGYNCKQDKTGGGCYWLLSPNIKYDCDVRIIDEYGDLCDSDPAWTARPMSPAFCI